MFVVVVGAGLAGLVAARNLRAEGIRVKVLEARKRVGGRVASAFFNPVGAALELGAEWFVPSVHTALAAELRRHGLVERVYLADTTYVLANERGLPLRMDSSGILHLLRRATGVIDRHAASIPFDRPDWHIGCEDFDRPFCNYLDRIGADGPERALLLAAAFELMGADETEYSALHFLHEIAGLGSAKHLWSAVDYRVPAGELACEMAKRLEQNTDVEITLDTPVREVTAAQNQCRVTTGDGDDLYADAVIVAVPVNCLPSIDLPSTVPNVAAHAGRVAKVWTGPVVGGSADQRMVTWPGVVETYGFDGPRGIAFASFTLNQSGAEQAQRNVLSALRERSPGAPPGDQMSHDWCGDPYSLGTWCAAKPGQLHDLYLLCNHPPPIVFAGGDISRRWMGWMDGAITSGADAARRSISYLRKGDIARAIG